MSLKLFGHNMLVAVLLFHPYSLICIINLLYSYFIKHILKFSLAKKHNSIESIYVFPPKIQLQNEEKIITIQAYY